MAWFGPAPRANREELEGNAGEATPPVRSDISTWGGKRQGAGEQALTRPLPARHPTAGEGREARRRRLPTAPRAALAIETALLSRPSPLGGGWLGMGRTGGVIPNRRRGHR